MQKNEMVHGKQKFVIRCMSRLCIFFLINISFCCEIVFSQNALFKYAVFTSSLSSIRFLDFVISYSLQTFSLSYLGTLTDDLHFILKPVSENLTSLLLSLLPQTSFHASSFHHHVPHIYSHDNDYYSFIA